MRSEAEISQALALVDAGHNDCEIARITGIPRKAILCASLDALGVHWTRPCDRQIAIYPKSSVRILDGFIGPKR
jgi:hypothetical protein